MHHALIALPAEASQVRPARKFTTTHLARWGVTDTDRDRAELIVSELAGNAVRHGRSDMTVHLSLIDRSLHIDVIDTGRLRGARSGATTAADEAGRGLSLVGLVADWTDIRREKHGWQAHVGLRVARQRDDSLSMDMVDSPAPASADFGR
jgi:anti-sigma regulatory factor (Ser/Thr protein kinase)